MRRVGKTKRAHPSQALAGTARKSAPCPLHFRALWFQLWNRSTGWRRSLRRSKIKATCP